MISSDFCHFKWFLSVDINFYLFIENEEIPLETVRNCEKPQEIIKNQEQLLGILDIIEEQENQ